MARFRCTVCNWIYDEVVFTWDSDGDGDLATGNGRGIAVVLTGTDVHIQQGTVCTIK